MKTGKVIEDMSRATGFGRTASNICPAAPGGKDWQPTSWSPRTRLLYIPHNNLCMDYEGVEAHYIASAPYVGASVKMYAGPGGNGGEFSAWDPVQKKKAWRLEEKFPAWSGALATAGDIVFYDGVGGWSGAIMAGGLDPRDKTSALGFVGAMKDLPDHTAKGGTIYVFSLP